MATIVMSKVLGYEAPFEDLGIGSDAFIPIKELENRKISFIGAKEFENDKGPGIYIAFVDDEVVGYTTTHSVTLMDVFGSDGVKQAFERGDTIEGTIKQRISKKSGRPYFMVE